MLNCKLGVQNIKQYFNIWKDYAAGYLFVILRISEELEAIHIDISNMYKT